MLAIISGEVETGVFALSSGATNKDKVRVIAQTGVKRHPLLPDVPTTIEAGMPDVGIIFWFGIFASPNTPQPIVNRLSNDLELTLKDPENSKKIREPGRHCRLPAIRGIVKRVTEEEQKWGDLIPKMGFKPE